MIQVTNQKTKYKNKVKTYTKANPKNNWSKTTTSYLTTPGQKKTYNAMNTQLAKNEAAVNNYGKFNNPYKGQMNNTLNQINNSKFSYDVNQDELYNQYKEQYQSMGRAASQQAQAEATALTGGFSNSYAAQHGSEAYQSYLTQLQTIVPQLYQQARTDYDTNMNNLYNKANLYNSLGQQAFSEWQSGLDQAIANREYQYNKANNYYNSTAKQTTKNKQKVVQVTPKHTEKKKIVTKTKTKGGKKKKK